jgi:hypothetical protein
MTPSMPADVRSDLKSGRTEHVTDHSDESGTPKNMRKADRSISA